VAAVHAAHRSRRTQTFFFDAGAHIEIESNYGNLGGSTDWLVNWYGPSVTFDHVYAWALPATPANFDNVGKGLLPFLHYYPHGVTATKDDVFNVLTVIKKVCRPEDFVVFKLDIDTKIEESIAHTVMSDPELQALIDEFFWEKHFHNPVMAMHHMGGNNRPRLDAWYAEVIPARQRGLRMHGWP
jgi:hypothetical protein